MDNQVKKNVRAPILNVKGLQVSSLNRRIIDDINFSIDSNEVFCLIGESGSGKSMTASAVMRLLPSSNLKITKGSIFLDSLDLVNCNNADMRKVRGNKISMVFQEPMTALNPLMRVGQQIAEVIEEHDKSLSKKEIKEKAICILKDVHMPNPKSIFNVYPHQLSGGQRQRVVIAMAIAMEPKLIIADEPTTALDVTTQAQVLKLFNEIIGKRNSSLLFITHDFDVVKEIGDRVAVMKDGAIVECGKVSDIFENPQNEYTQLLLDAVPHGQPKVFRSANKAPVLQVKDVSLIYDGDKGLLSKGRTVKAVDDVSLELFDNETLGIVGESGSGKSSLGRCITGAQKMSTGEIFYKGHNISNLGYKNLIRLKRKIQMIFQDPYRSLNPRKKIIDTLIEGPLEAGTTRRDAIIKARELLELVDLPQSSLDRYPHQFSGGQRQRICIARALIMEPELIIADEAVSALDVSVQSQVLELLEELQKKLQFSMIFITHDLRVAMQVCDRIAVMQKGKIVELREAPLLLTNPAHVYTKRLFDAVPGGRWEIKKISSEDNYAN